MIAMALAALGPFVLVEGLLVFAAVEQTGIGRMTKTATPAHAGNAWRDGGVVAVTVVAGGRAQIAAFEQRAAMHAGAKFGQLSGRQRRAVGLRKSGHGRGIGVACAAGFRHPLRVNLRLRIFRRPNSVDAVATHAGGSAIVMLLEQQRPCGLSLNFAS